MINSVTVNAFDQEQWSCDKQQQQPQQQQNKQILTMVQHR